MKQRRGATTLKTRLARVALLLASTAVGLVATEVFLRVAGIARETDQSNSGLVYDRSGSFRKFQPELQAVSFSDVAISTNRFGFRSPEMRLEKSPGVFRIAILGDSWGFGWGVKDGETLVDRFRALVQAAGQEAGQSFEVFNFACPGLNLKDHFHALQDDVVRFKPDLCLVLLHLNDIDGLAPQKTSNWTPPGFYDSLRLAKFVYSYGVLPLAVWMELPNPGFVATFQRKYSSAGTLDLYRDYAERIAEVLDRAELEAVFYLFPLPLAKRSPYQLQGVNDQIKAVFDALGIEVHELLDSYASHSKGALVLHPLDGHPSAFASELLARELFEHISRQSVLPLGAPRRPTGDQLPR